MVLLTSPRPAVPNERLYVDDTVSRLFGCHFPSIKNTPENAVNKWRSKACCVCFAKGKRVLLKGGYLKTTFVCIFCPSEPGLHPGLCFEEYRTKIYFYVYIGIMKFISHIIIGCV